MTFSTPIHTNEQSFERVLATGLPLVLVFTRKNSAPCTTLDTVLSRLAISYEGQVLIAKVNVDENPSLAQRYTISALPGIVFLRAGKVVAQATGALTREQLQPWMDYLARGGAQPATVAGPSEPLNTAQPAQAAPPTGAAGPVKLTDATFEAAIKGNQPVLVDFWAAWCGPCRTIAPSVDALAKEFAGRAVVAKLNVDENPRTAQRFNVMSIPTLLIFKGGRVVDQVVGAQPLTALRQALARHV